jgi:hypothetical protein
MISARHPAGDPAHSVGAAASGGNPRLTTNEAFALPWDQKGLPHALA